MKKKKSYQRVLHGTTPEERFKEITGLNFDEWSKKQQKELEINLGMTLEEWFIKKVNSITPLEFLKEYVEPLTAKEEMLIAELRSFGLTDSIINVLLYYANLLSNGNAHYKLIILLGRQWSDDNINTVERATDYAKQGIKEFVKDKDGWRMID